MNNDQPAQALSDKELLEIIRLIGMELDAYQNLCNGFKVLMDLPENSQGRKHEQFRAEYLRYSTAERSCSKFLSMLHDIKAKRGIKNEYTN